MTKNNMITTSKHSAIFCFILLITLFSCDKKERLGALKKGKPLVKPPDFNADSAYHFVKEQVRFGPRVPNTPSHQQCGDYLISKLKSYGANVIEQEFQAKAYNDEKLNGRNIIASFYPRKKKRVLLAAHWDTRHLADKDDENKYQPIEGANDGASGVGVCLEIARILANDTPSIGVDIILFDLEDYGESHIDFDLGNESGKVWWCLGSQYWAANKHTPNYSAYYGILYDMVGAQDARFYKEGTSMHYAPGVMNKFWNIAQNIGYGKYFLDRKVQGVMDDHAIVNRNAHINMIDIIEHDPENGDFFAKYHHTHKDNISIISKETLKAVGQTSLQVLYNE